MDLFRRTLRALKTGSIQRLLGLSFLLTLLTFYYYQGTGILQEQSIIPASNAKESVSSTTKTILIWNAHSRFELEVFGEGRLEFADHCPINDCYITQNRSFKAIQDFDAILFNMPPLSIHKFPLNEPREPGQRYVFFSQEPPVYIGEEVAKFNHLFNWTMSCKTF